MPVVLVMLRAVCGLRAVVRRVIHARSELARNNELRNRRRAMTEDIFT